MIREALRDYPFIGMTLFALVLFVAAWLRMFVRTLSAPKQDMTKSAALPLEET